MPETILQPRRTDEDWTGLIETFLAAGQTQKAFCQQRGINFHSFRHRYQRSPLFRGKRRQAPDTNFQRVTVSSEPPPLPQPWVVHCGAQVRIDCPADTSVEALIRLVRGLTDVA